MGKRATGRLTAGAPTGNARFSRGLAREVRLSPKSETGHDVLCYWQSCPTPL